MKKLVVASFVGAVIIFMWNALSWMALPVHLDTFKFAPNQDSVLSLLDASGIESGAYSFPMADNRNIEAFDSKYKEQCEKVFLESIGKPSAMVFFTKSTSGDMMSSFLLGFLYVFVLAFSVTLILILASNKLHTFGGRFWLVMLIAMLFAIQGPLTDHNWMQFPWHYVRGALVDIIASWGLCGLWLSWYLGRK